MDSQDIRNITLRTEVHMKDKYVEQDFPHYFVFGEHLDGRVDIATGTGSAVATVSKEDAEKLIQHRDAIVQKLCDMARAFDEASPDKFRKFWYGY